MPDTVHPLTPPAEDHVASPVLSMEVNTYPANGLEPLMVKPMARTVPCTSSTCPGHAEPIPTLPLPLMIKLPPAAVHVPMPTLPIETKPVCGEVVPTPTLPLMMDNAASPIPLINAVPMPTFLASISNPVGAVVPMPTFPLVLV